jgi:hypothetical protein
MPTPTTLGRADDRVREHLRVRGFTGHIRLATWAVGDGDRVTTEVKQSDGPSVPWTPHLIDWLLNELEELPGCTEVWHPAPGVIRVTWAGAR